MRLTYLYVRHRGYTLEKLQTDGHYEFFRELVKRGYLERVRIILENYADRRSRCLHSDEQLEVWSVHDVPSEVTLEPQEAVWVRGGWKSWIPWIDKHLPNHWFLFYAANSGRAAWSYWDVVLEDREESYAFPDKKGRLRWYFRKPVAPDFRTDLTAKPKWDLCVGASHLYDRKQQFRTLPVCDAFRRLTGRDLRCVIPGCFYSHEVQTEAMKRRLRAGEYPNIHLPGMLHRADLADVFNRSRFFYAATCGGQGDRSALEAAACGCRLVSARRRVHAPYLTADERYAFVPSSPDATDEIAAFLARELEKEEPSREECAAYHERNGGLEACVTQVAPVLALLRDHPKEEGREVLGRLVEDPF